MAFPQEHQNTAGCRKAADLLEILLDRRRHTRPSALHRVPLTFLVAAEQPRLERSRVGTSQNRISPVEVHRDGPALSTNAHECPRICPPPS